MLEPAVTVKQENALEIMVSTEPEDVAMTCGSELMAAARADAIAVLVVCWP